MKAKRTRIISFLLAVCISAASLLFPGMQPQAASVDKKVYIGVKAKECSIGIWLKKGEYNITNLKTSSKNLYARVTYIRAYEDPYNKEDGLASISLYAKKKGKYTVTFDVTDRKKRKKSSHKVRVYANNDRPFQKVTFGGRKLKLFEKYEEDGYDVPQFSSRTKGKLKVVMAKGYKLCEIEITGYDKSGNMKSRNLKNGSLLTLSQYRVFGRTPCSETLGPSAVVQDGELNPDDWIADLMALTEITIRWENKATKRRGSASCILCCTPKN